MKIVAQIIGLLAVATFLLSYQQKKRNNIILINFISRCLYILQYLLLGAFSGAIFDILAAVSSVFSGKKHVSFIKKHVRLIVIIINTCILAVGVIIAFFNKSFLDLFALAGVLFEINALWYNELKFIEAMAVLTRNEEVQNSLVRLIPLVGKAFTEVFLNEYGYLYDYVDGDYVDWSVRPNMIFAVALDYSPLDAKQRKKVLDTVTKELLTPRGLRSLSPKSVGYNPNYVGPQIQRDYAYHQGTAWPWLGGFYYEAYLKTYKMSGVSFVQRQMIGFEDEIVQHCIGSIPEVFDGNPPFKGRGAVAFAMNVAAILRTSQILKQYESKMEG